MKTRGEVIQEYKVAFQAGMEGARLLETLKMVNALSCSDEMKALCLKEEIDSILCGYMESKKN